jgi:N-acyl-D-amino-acid deacylase
VHDLVIENAVLIDGLGNPARPGALAIKGGRIAALGEDVGAARERVDAHGMALAPGIVDLHTHFDAQLIWDPFATPSVKLGVTTAVIGNCGFTLAPCRAQDRDLTLRNLTHVEGMSLEALREGVKWDFESYPQYLEMLERNGVVPNIASFIGHSAVRTYVLGKDASKRAATRAEVAEMKQIVLDALRAGAVGFATTTLEQHSGENGVPMPSRLADEHEILELTSTLGEAKRGVFMLTKGNNTSVPWLEEVAARNGRPVMIAAMFVDPNDPDRVFDELKQIQGACSRGHELWAQAGCFPFFMELTLRHPYPLEAFAAWQPAMEAEGSDAYQRILADPSFRAAIKAEAKTRTIPNRFSYHSIETMTIKAVTLPKHQGLVGRKVAAEARAEGKDPFDWLLDFGLDGELDALMECQMFNSNEDQLRDLIMHPNAAIALSDAGAHLSFLCDAGFGLHLLGRWARERKDMTLEQAVAQVSSKPADIYRIRDRGRLQVGAWADLMLFDPATVGRGEKRRVADLPAGASRVDTPAVGLHGVWINGVRAVDESGAIENCGRPGKVMREFGI